MTQPKPLSQAAIAKLGSLMNRILVIDDLSKPDVFNAYQNEVKTILATYSVAMDRRAMARECAGWFLEAKAEGHTLASITEAMGLGQKDVCFSKALCYSFLDEDLRERLIKVFSSEAEYLGKVPLLRPFEEANRRAKWEMSIKPNPSDSEKIRRAGKTLPESVVYVPLTLGSEGPQDETTLRGILQPSLIDREVTDLFKKRKDDLVSADECVRLLNKMTQAFRFQSKTIHKQSCRELSELSLLDNEPLRAYLMGDKPPTLQELSTKTHAFLSDASHGTKPGEAARALNNLAYTVSTNTRYLDRCLVPDMVYVIRQDVAQDDRDMADEFKGGRDRLMEYSKGFKTLRSAGARLDLVLLLGVCDHTAGAAYDLLDAGPVRVLQELLHRYMSLDITMKKDLGTVTSMYYLAGITSHDQKDIAAAIGNNDDQARVLYEATGDAFYIHNIGSDKMKEDILGEDLGL